MANQLLDCEKHISEETWRKISEDILIAVYVPEADQMSREDALDLAMERDRSASEVLVEDVCSPSDTLEITPDFLEDALQPAE